MKAVVFLLVGLLLATAVVAGPFGTRYGLEEKSSQTECSELTRFREGYSYTFSYEAVTETGITGAGPGSTMTMTCDITIEAPERCRNVLRTTSCRLDESPELALEMSAHDLIFRTDKGRINEVLAHPDEPTHVLNAKRGILSLLQLDMEADDVDHITLNEVSVHGNCNSDMTVTMRDENERPRKIDVVTDLNNCMLRKMPENMTTWQSLKDIVFNTRIVDKFINSSKTCSYDVKGSSGEFRGVECSEVHSFWPMNFNSESGVRTSIRQRLQNTNVVVMNSFKVDAANTRLTCLRYEHDPKEIDMKPSDVTADQAIDILKKLVKGSLDEVQMDSPRLFGRWRAALEGMNNATIHEVFDRAYDCSEYSQTCRDNPDKAKLAREYLLDGLLPCTTMACFSVKNYAIAKGVVPKPLAKAWMVTMAFRRYPSLEVMSEMLRMAQAVPSQITIFPLSIMIHNYWVNNEEIHTANVLPEPMTNTIRYLRSLIGTDCTVPAENERLALIALKAIGNIGEPVERHDQLTFTYSEKVSPVLVSCTQNKQIPRDISKGAIQAMRRFVLNNELRHQVIDHIFKDTTLDVPQRIAAYLIAMKANPNIHELIGIWSFLKTEPVNQMKAFCYSHIKSVLESSEPTLQMLKTNMRTAMVDEVLPDYRQDVRKYSRYFEISRSLTEPWRNNTVAAQFEGDIVFTPESYMPQEVMFHYVLNALGKSWDIFETGVEMKGFEPILESVFGPEGFFPEVTLQTIFENIDEKILTKVREFAEAQLENWASPTTEKTNKQAKNTKKVKRQSGMDSQQVADLIHATTMSKLTQLHKLVGMETSATDATVFLRLLGNEFGFVSASDVLSIIPYTMGIMEELLAKTKQIPQLLSQGLDLHTTRSLVFMDKSFILPTGMGMPLNCSINGTAVISLRVKSQFSINLPMIIAAGHIAPSGAVEILATMGIGMPTKVFTGVMANSAIYHSSKIAGNITLDGTRLKVNLNNMDRPMNLFNYSTTYNLLKANGAVEFIPGVLQDAVRNQRCTDVSKVFGVDLCVSWAYPNASYVSDAPRFPFAGPNSFNISLVNTDTALKAYTIDAQYKQIKEGGAQTPVAFSSVGKRSNVNSQPITKLVDTVRISFYAPGEVLTRNMTSLLSVDRLQKTVKWTFTVPEVRDFTMFAGILNEMTDTGSAYRAVFNVSTVHNAASVDFLVKNEATLAQQNLTAVFNASIKNLYWAAVGQFVRDSSSRDWNAHLTQTYYWDNETPLYRQILFPWTGYRINHEKYQTAAITARRHADGPVVIRDLKMATLGWAYDVNTRHTVTDDLKELTFTTKISNATWELPLMDISLRNDTTETGYRMEGRVSRNTRHAFVSYDVIKEPRETNRQFRMGLRTDVFINNPDAAMFMNSPVLLRLFGETALIDEPVIIDGGMDFRILDQSADNMEYLIQTSILIPNPRNPTSHLTYEFDLRLENATVLNQKDVTLELTLPISLLKLKVVNLLRVRADIETGTATGEHHLTLFDTRYNKAQATMSNVINAGWKKPSANWVMNVQTPSLTYSQNYTGVYSRENGVQLFYEYSQDSADLDLLDYTETNNMFLKPTAVSTYWSYIHKLFSYNVSNSLILGGPITEMHPRLVPRIVRDVLNKTIGRDFSGVKDIVLNMFIYNVTGSSVTLRQGANFLSPLLANMTVSHYLLVSKDLLDHKLYFLAEQKRINIYAALNHSMVIENRELTLKTVGNMQLRRGLQLETLTSVNATLLKVSTPFDLAALHNTRVTGPVLDYSTIISVNGNVGENKMLNMVANHNTCLSSRLASVDIIGNYHINDMSSPTYFDEMTGLLTYRMSSLLVQSSLNSSVSFNTFRKLFKFQKVQAMASHDIKSSIINWNARAQSLLQHFSSIIQFGEVSSSLEAGLLSERVSASHSSGLALRNMNGLVQFDELTGHLRNNLTGKFVNSTYETEFNFNNVESLVSFRKLGSSSNYVLSSRLMNATANNTLELNGFHSLFNFDSIIVNQVWIVNTRRLNGMMDNGMVLNGFRKLFNFDAVSGHMNANFTSLLAKGTTHNTLLIQNVESITSLATVAIESTSDFISRAANISHSSALAINNHRSFLNFDSITSTTNISSRILRVVTSIKNEINLIGVRSLVNFDSIGHSFSMAREGYLLNTNMSATTSLQNFRHFNQFDLASVEVLSSFVTRRLMVSYQQSHRVEHMDGWFQCPRAETVIMGDLITRRLNMSSSYVARLLNMRAPFDYDSSVVRIEYAVNNRLINVTGFHGFEVNNMRGVFQFDRINGTISHAVDTILTHTAIGGLLDMNNFNGLFHFDLMNVNTSNIISITPLTTTLATYNAGIALRGFERMTQFGDVRGYSRSAILTRWTNWTTNMETEFSGFRSLMDFDRISVAGQNEFTSPLIVMMSNTTNGITGSTGFFRASSAQTTNMLSISSRFAKVQTGALWQVTELTGPFSFTSNQMRVHLNISTPLINTGSGILVEMNDWQNLTRFGRIEANAENNIFTRIANWIVQSHFRLDNMAGILTYSRVEGSTTSMFSSIISSVNASINAHINGQAGFLTYDEMMISTRSDVSTLRMELHSGTDFNIAHMAGFMKYDSISGSASSNMTSRLLSTTVMTNLQANVGTGLFKVQLANVTGSVMVSTPFTNEIKASSSSQITNSRKLFNFDEALMKSEVSFLTTMINVTASAKSTLSNFVNITNFDSIESSADMMVSSRLINTNAGVMMEMRGFQRLFRFDKVRAGGYGVIKTVLANMTTEAEIDFANFQRMFVFERINGSAIASLTSRFATLDAKTAMEMINFNGLTTFERMNGSFFTDVTNRFINTTTGLGYSLQGFRSLFNFDKVETSAEVALTNRFINGTTMAEYTLSDATAFCRFAKLTARSAGSFNTKLATGKAFAGIEMTDMQNLTRFGLFNITSAARFTSKPVNALAEGVYAITNQRSLFNFDDVTGHAYGYIRSKVLSVTATLESQMNNSRALLGFDAAKLQGNVFVRTPVRQANFHGQLNMIDFTDITHYVETSAMVTTNITGPRIAVSGYSRINISRMAGIMTFDKFLTDSSVNVESRLLNTTLQNSISLTGFRGITYSAIGHRFNLLWAGPVNELIVRNGLDMTSRQDMAQIFNITWMNPKGTIVFKQRLDYENVIATIKVPSIGLLTAGANLNTFGDMLTFYIEHQLLRDNFRSVKDVTWFLRLNESNVIYSNFSWNPDTVAEIVDITVGVINNTFNRTVTIANSTIAKIMEVANLTLTHTRRMTNCTKCFMRYTMTLAKDTLRATLIGLNETLYDKAMTLNQTIYTQLKMYNETLYARIDKLNKTINFARSNPREFIGMYVNLTRINETRHRLNETLRELYAKLRYNISHPRETLENIKILIKFEQRRDRITWLLENRDVVKERITDYLRDLRANLTRSVRVAIADFKERIQYDDKIERITNYVQSRFNVSKIQEKIQEFRLRIDDVKQKMTELKLKVREKVDDLKMRIAALDRETVKTEIRERIRNFLRYILNSTTLHAINSSIFIDYTDDAQVQELMRKLIHIRPRNLVNIINKDSVMDVKDRLLAVKDRIVQRLEALNQTTFRYVNKTFLNETAKQTIERLRQLNATLHEFVNVNIIKADIELVLNNIREKMANITNAVRNIIKAKADIMKTLLKEKWDARPKSLEELKTRMAEMKQILKDNIQERYNIDIDLLVENFRTKQIERREQLKLVISKLIAISKNETHPINMLPLCYFNRTIYQIVQPPVNRTLSLTLLLSKTAANNARVYGKEAINFTKRYSRIAMEKGVAMTKKYVPIIKTALKDYKLIAMERGKIMKERAILFVAMAKGNASIYYQMYAPIVNETMRNYIRFARGALFNYTVKVRNITHHYINVTKEILEPHVQPYREMMMEKVERMRLRAANLKERVRQLPAQTEKYLMGVAEYHIERYPEYKQRTIQRVDEMKIKLEELKVNLTRLFNEVKTNMTRLYGKLKQNATEAYIRFAQRVQDIYTRSQGKFTTLKMQARQRWQEVKPIIMSKSSEFIDATRMRYNVSLEALIFRTKDEFSMMNELPMRVLDKTIFQLTTELRDNIRQIIEDVRSNLKSRDSLMNRYPVMYRNMTLYEVGQLSYEKVQIVSSLTRVYANRTLCWANTTLVTFNETIHDIMIRSNKAMGQVIIPFVNQTTRDVIVFLNRTRFQPWRATLKEIISFLNRSSIVLRNRANETVIVVQARAIDAWRNLTSEESLARMRSFLNEAKDMIINRLRVANETIFMLRNKTRYLILYIRDETPLRNISKEYALLAKNFTQKSIMKARSMTENTIILARNKTKSIVLYLEGPGKEFIMEYVTFINNTMAGWAFRYYGLDQIRSQVRMRLEAIKPVEMARNLTAFAINRTRLMTKFALIRSEVMTRYAMNQTRVLTQFALNRTRTLTKQAVHRTRTLIRDTLNTIGRLDDHSFAMNFSHPFNWTSFRTRPRLSNNQIMFIRDKVTQLNQTVVIPIMNKIKELRHNLTERYNNISIMVTALIDLKRPIVQEKIEDFRLRIQEKMDEYKQLLNEYKDLLRQKWETEWKPRLLERKTEVINKWENEIRPRVDEMVINLKTFVRDPERLTKLRENARYIKDEYLPELRRVIREEKIPEIRRIILDEKIPEIKRRVLAKYAVAKAIFEDFKHNVTVFRQQMQIKIQNMTLQAKEKWTELQEKIRDLKQNWPETYNQLKADIEDIKIQLKAKLSEFINRVLSVLRELRIPIEILPLEHIKFYNPWKYTAMLFGDNHIMTFDGKVYSIPPFVNEQQTYVLAHDFIDRNFTLLAQKRRMTLMVRDMSVAIDDQNVVYVNGLPTMQELPYQTSSKELTIMRKGPWVNVTVTNGIALSCHIDHHLCIFHLSGWYHGKSRGLLGNLDTEHHNEFILPEGDITTDIANFISAYDVSPYDMPRNVIPSRFGACASRQDKCRDMFLDENSLLNETFNIINKTEFFNFCVEQTRMCHESCEATNPVVTLGKELRVNVAYDPECLDCNLGDLTQERARSTRYADVMFVVSETAAMAEDNIIKSSLRSIVTRITTKLNAYNVTTVNYGIAAFGGSDIHGKPHSHTLCGHLMDTSVNCVESGVDSLVFQGVKPIDAMQAIQLAASYPFRKEAAKIVILITDEDLNEESGNRWDYLFNINTSLPAMQSLLDRQGITFNVFSSYPTLNKKTTESPILGVNYLGKQIINKKNSGEEGIDRLAIPKGQYAKLAKATRGSIMGLHWLQTGHRDLGLMLPKVIWKQIQPQVSGMVDYNCLCVLGVYGEGRVECQMTTFIDNQF